MSRSANAAHIFAIARSLQPTGNRDRAAKGRRSTTAAPNPEPGPDKGPGEESV